MIRLIIILPLSFSVFSSDLQIIVAMGSICGSMTAGMTSGYSAVLLPQLQSNTSEIRISESTATWIASMAVLPMALGCLLGGVLMEQYGRKVAHLILSVPFAIGWLLIGFANNLVVLLVGRFISGACVGLLGPPGSVMIGEISAPKYRGLLLAGVSLAIALGILISHVLGTFLHWQTTALICSLFPMICFLILVQVPESPSWLLARGRLDEAKYSFQWYRGTEETAESEFQDLFEKQMTNKAKSPFGNLREEMKNPTFIKPMMIILAFFFITQFCGVNFVAFYSVSLMQKTLGKGGMDKYMATILIDVVRLIMSTLACVFMRQVGRRGLALFSAVGTAMSLFGLTAYLYLSARGSVPVIPVLPLVLLVLYICCISIGLVPLPWCMIGELFPLSVRGMGSGIAAAFNFLIFFIVVQTGPAFISGIGPEGAFLIYGSVAFIGAFYLYFCLPETKNRTLQQIEDSFQTPKLKSVDIDFGVSGKGKKEKVLDNL